MTDRPQPDVALLASKVAALPPRSASAENRDVAASSTVRSPSKLRRFVWWTCFFAAWCATIGLLAIAVLRVFYHDGAFVLIWINSFTRYVYLPAYLCLAWAVWQRRWVLSISSLALVGFHLALMAPDFLRDRRFDVDTNALDTPTAESDSLRIFFANVLALNNQFDALLEEIAETDPDVIVLVEFSGPWYRAFQNSPIMAPYIHGSGHLRSHINTVNVFSKLPLANEIQNWVRGRAVHTIDISLGSSPLRIVGLHAPRPVPGPKYDYAEYWNEMIPLLTAEQGPLVVVGDFNATEHSKVYKQLTESKLRSAHDDQGRGYAVTWPNGQNPCPPVRIDQALVSPEIEVERIVEGRGRGSDHKPLILDVRIRGWSQR
ncbi:MAG TPA: endonuclease/exonuclease/phosphatase family protein [Lacipirellulaceae bacterium]|nr:endonuclease/exonuclease/phosphatase family protein [Lacipirellulaceae bacterium]